MLSGSDWETSKPWENDKEVEVKDSFILQDVTGSKQFGQNSGSGSKHGSCECGSCKCQPGYSG